MKALNLFGAVLALLTAAAIWLALSTLPSAAAAQCAPRDQAMSILSDRFGESRRGIGIAANAGVLEVYANGRTGSWSVTITGADGTTCLVASGQNWEDVAPADIPPGTEG